MSDGNRGAYVGWCDQSWPQNGYNSYVLSAVPYAGPLGVPSASLQATADLRVWPNPVHEAVRLQFSLRDASPARVELIDVTGHRIRAVELHGAGEQSARFEGLEGLPSGVYFVRVTQGGVIRTARVALVH